MLPWMTSWRVAEEGIVAAYRVRDYTQCTALAVKFAGAGIKAYLRKAIGDQALVEDAFSEWSELVATSWPKYDPAHPVSTWLYLLARRPRGRAMQARAKRRAREVTLDHAPAADGPREKTAPHVRTTVKHEFRELWEELPPADRQLLHWRIEDGLSWEQVARRLRGPEWCPSAQELTRETQTLAARYKRRVKDVLASKAQQRGLIDRFGDKS